MTITVVLAHRNQVDLDHLLTAIATRRAGPISHAEFVQRFAPDRRALQLVQSALLKDGFTVLSTTESMVVARASTATVERTFATAVHNVRGSDHRDHFGPIGRPIFPAEIANFLSVVVLDNLEVARVR